MATKIFYNDNRIIIDGHADTEQECQAITAMCDSLDRDDNFKTIAYDKGYALFERIGGGEKMMFAALEAQVAALKQQVAAIKSCECDLSLYLSKNEAHLTYETKTAHEASIALLQTSTDKINTTLGYVDTSKGSVADQLSYLNLTIVEVQNLAEKAIKLAEEAGRCKCDLTPLKESMRDLDVRMSALEARLAALEATSRYTLPYTAEELVEKLGSL